MKFAAANAPNPDEMELLQLLRYSADRFNKEYRNSENDSVFFARFGLEELLRTGKMSSAEFKGTLDDPTKFNSALLAADKTQKEKEQQRIHTRLSTLERNTHWKAAATISLATGLVTGLVFAFTGPFFNAWLQPTADELFKRKPPQQIEAKHQPSAPIIHITNNYYIIEQNIVRPAAKPKKPVHKSRLRRDQARHKH